MFERFDGEARAVITRAQEIAREFQHNWIGTEHLLLGLENTAGGAVITALGTTFDTLREGVLKLVGSGPAPLSGAPAFTPRAKKVLELALRESLARGDRSIRPEHVLLGIVREGEGVGCVVLAEAGIGREQLAPVLGEATISRRRRFRGSVPRSPFDLEPAGDPVTLRARALARGGPVDSHHYLLAILGDEDSRASKVLRALGLTRDAVEAKLDELGTVDVEIGGQRFDVTPEKADQLRKWLSGEAPPPSAS